MLDSSLIQITVVVCTFNRADLLCDILQTLAAQSLDPKKFEILVVDNNSTDDTRSVSNDFCRKWPNFRYVQEESQGLSFARNRGWQEAMGLYVAYVDDDCKIPEDWLRVAAKVIDEISPAVFGGPFFPFYNSRKPAWYKDSYGSHDPYTEARILNEKECVNIYGGNMFFRRSLLQKLNGFDVNFGMTGNTIAYGEETALMKRISKEFPDELIYFDPELFVYHLVRENKMTMSFSIRQRFISGGDLLRISSNERVEKVNKIKLFFTFLKGFAFLVIALVRGIVVRDRKLYPYFQNYIYEYCSKYVGQLGQLYQLYRLAP